MNIEKAIRQHIEETRNHIFASTDLREVRIFFWYGTGTIPAEWTIEVGYSGDIKVSGVELKACAEEFIRRVGWKKSQLALAAPLEAKVEEV